MSQGYKNDAGKPRMSLLPTRGLFAISKVLGFGAEKYGAHNWQLVDNAPERYADALLRHVFAWTGGETNDPESGLNHLAHAGCCILFLLHFEEALNCPEKSDSCEFCEGHGPVGPMMCQHCAKGAI